LSKIMALGAKRRPKTARALDPGADARTRDPDRRDSVRKLSKGAHIGMTALMRVRRVAPQPAGAEAAAAASTCSSRRRDACSI
jgi:hypothetical protein